MRRATWVVWAAAVWATQANAATIQTVPIGSAGNAADTRYVAAGRGAVSYGYSIGKFEVTAAQYAEFLNAVAKQDTYSVYHASMATDSGIQRSGSPGSYVYAVAAAIANRPVTPVSYFSACRFANWLSNGQPTGPQDLTTEDGSYFLDGSSSGGPGAIRKPAARWVIPTIEEWYKAAYFNGSSYWTWPTNAAVSPLTEAPPGGSNSANAGNVVAATTDVGAYVNTPGPWGTFDMGGNVAEMLQANQTVGGPSEYYVRGGYFGGDVTNLRASNEGWNSSFQTVWTQTGFRVALVPEPAMAAVLVLLPLARRRRPCATGC